MEKLQKRTHPALFARIADIKKFFRLIVETGPLNTLRRLVGVSIWRFHAYWDRNFDRKYNLDTSSHAYSWDLSLQTEGDDIGEDEPLYLPTSSLAFWAIFCKLPRDFSEFAFVDYGSGKGRTLLLASNYNFKEIIGVEFADQLHLAAEDNIAKWKGEKQRCSNIQSKHADATLYDIPDDKCVLYFFHPFEDMVMRKVMTRINKSYLRNPRKMYVVYYKAIYPEPIVELDIFKKLDINPRFPTYFMPIPFEVLIFETPD